MISQNSQAPIDGGFFGLGSSEAAPVEGGRKRKHCPKGSRRSKRKGYEHHCVRKEGGHTMYRRRSRRSAEKAGSPWEWKRAVPAKSTRGRRSFALRAHWDLKRRGL